MVYYYATEAGVLMTDKRRGFEIVVSPPTVDKVNSSRLSVVITGVSQIFSQ